MSEEAYPRTSRANDAARRPRALKRLWTRVREPLKRSRIVKNVVVSLLSAYLRFTRWTNPLVAGSDRLDDAAKSRPIGIVVLWHGQHILAPVARPPGYPMVAMFSRSADAELNAMVAERFGFKTVRGSGGRADGGRGKGGASALLALKKHLDSGTTVAMVADIAHGRARQSGLGVVTLARFSGRPVYPLAVVTSRRKVIARSWDKTTINLPFGRSAIILGDPIHVPADADDAALEAKREEITGALDEATKKAYGLVDGTR